MVAGSSPDGGRAQAISHGVRNTIRSIKEIVGDHSESDIYDVLRETNMDPNETTQRLLDQDPFHEVRRRREKRKENAGYNGTSTNDSKIQNESRTERKMQNERRAEWKQNGSRTAESRQNESRTESRQNNSESRTENKKQNEIRTEFIKTERNGYNNARTGRGGYARTGRGGLIRNSAPGPVKEYRIVRDNRNKQKASEEQLESVSVQNLDSSSTQIHVSNNINNSSKQESTLLTSSIQPIKSNLAKKELMAEICSSSDPIHVSVGLIRREVGVVGLRKPNPNSDSKNSVSIPIGNKGFSTEYPRQQHVRPNSRGNNRLNSQPLTNLNQHSGKAQQANMEWRPKSSQSPRNGPALTLTGHQKQSDVNVLSENLAKCKISEDLHVIIPEHLRVPESEQNRLVFGSFDSPENSKEGNNHTSLSSMSGPPNENLSSGHLDHNNTEINETQLRENSNMQEPSDEADPQNIITENVSHYESTLPHDLQDSSTDLQNFKEYDPHSRYDMQFLSSVGEENSVTQQTTVISTEAMSVGPSIMTSQIPINPTTTLQHPQMQLNNNSQQVPQMYPQLQLPQFATNYLPYRHVFSPVYMPQQIPVPNYQNAPAYPPPLPSPVPNYLLMPSTGTGTVSTGGIKYGTNQYKPVFNANGYGNYSNPNGYPGLIDDANRIKYKDNNTLYAPNLQVESSDIWVQTPRELPNIQSTPFYNVQAQPATPSYLTHNGPASYSATQQPQLQYPPLHQTGQPGSMTLLPPPPPPGPHSLSGLGAPAGPFQGNHQLGHLGWTTANF